MLYKRQSGLFKCVNRPKSDYMSLTLIAIEVIPYTCNLFFVDIKT